MSVEGNVLLALKLLEKFQLLFLFMHPLESGFTGLLIGIKDHFAFEPVHNSRHSVLELLQIHGDTDERRNIHHTGKDRRMRVGGTMDRDECKDFLLIHLHRLAGSKIIGNDHGWIDGTQINISLPA